MPKEFVVKFDPHTHSRTGFLRTLREKFYLGEDGILTIVPIEDPKGDFSGIIKGSTIKQVPSEFRERVNGNFHNLMRLHKAVQNKD